MDGYDGGVLPLQRYVTLEQLYMPEDGVAIDGRLREHLDSVPASRWLSLFNVRFVITDKVRDAWFDDVFYDLQLGARLANGDEAAVGYIPSTTSTALGIVYEANGAIEGTPLAYVDMRFSDGQEKSLSLVADDVDDGERIARLQWDRPATPESVRVRGAWETGAVNVRGLSLIDERTGAFFPLVLSDNGRYRLVHSGDVKIYENLDVIPRAFFVRQAVPAPDDEAALAAMRAGDFDPTATVVLVDDSLPPNDSRFVDQESRDTASAKVEITLYEPERVIAFIDAPANGWLVLSDSWYPGWQATVDGVPVPVERANILFRAVAVPEGQHYVEWVFRPWTFRLGAVISLSAIGLMLLILGWVGFSRALHRYSS
jgi:hypothetical protein